MKFLKKNFLLLLLILFLLMGIEVSAASNPYGKYQDLYGVKTIRCTWYAWQQAYDNAGVALPGWGNAQTWYNSAAIAGYSVGKDARPNSIAVWSSSDNYGHVAYVVSVDADGKYMTVNEAGIPTTENEGVIIGSRPSTSAANLIGFIYLDEAPKNNDDNYISSSQSNESNTSLKKSSNNNLTNLSIDIAEFVFNKDILEYNLEVPYDTQIITIKATAESDNAIVTGAGQKALKVGENNYSIIITAEDGSTKEYKINIDRLENTKNTIEEKTDDKNVINKKNSKKYIIIGTTIVIFVIGLIVFLIIRKKSLKNRQDA